MQSHVKIRAIRVLGGVVVALAVVPWLGVGAASASGGAVTCSTRPPGVSPDATCTPLLGPNGTKVFGETWAVRTAANHIVVDTFPLQPVVGADSVALCVRTSGPYPAKHQCASSDSDNVFTGSTTHIDVALASHGISAADPVWYGLSVLQGSSSAVSNGGVGVAATGTPTPTPTKTPSVSPSHSTSHKPSASVLPTKIGASPSTSVLGLKLAHTGGAGVTGALVVSIALLGFGGVLLAAAQTVPASARRRH